MNQYKIIFYFKSGNNADLMLDEEKTENLISFIKKNIGCNTYSQSIKFTNEQIIINLELLEYVIIKNMGNNNESI